MKQGCKPFSRLQMGWIPPSLTPSPFAFYQHIWLGTGSILQSSQHKIAIASAAHLSCLSSLHFSSLLFFSFFFSPFCPSALFAFLFFSDMGKIQCSRYSRASLFLFFFFFFCCLAIYSQKFTLKIIKIQEESPDFFYTGFRYQKYRRILNSHLFWLNSHPFFAHPIICRLNLSVFDF